MYLFDDLRSILIPPGHRVQDLVFLCCCKPNLTGFEICIDLGFEDVEIIKATDGVLGNSIVIFGRKVQNGEAWSGNGANIG